MHQLVLKTSLTSPASPNQRGMSTSVSPLMRGDCKLSVISEKKSVVLDSYIRVDLKLPTVAQVPRVG